MINAPTTKYYYHKSWQLPNSLSDRDEIGSEIPTLFLDINQPFLLEFIGEMHEMVRYHSQDWGAN